MTNSKLWRSISFLMMYLWSKFEVKTTCRSQDMRTFHNLQTGVQNTDQKGSRLKIWQIFIFQIFIFIFYHCQKFLFIRLMEIKIWKLPIVWLIFVSEKWSQSDHPTDTGRKLNVFKTFRRRSGHLLNVFSTFNLRPVSTGQLFFKDVSINLMHTCKPSLSGCKINLCLSCNGFTVSLPYSCNLVSLVLEFNTLDYQ